MQKEKRIDIEPHLFRLQELSDYEVSDNDPDVRGWNVYSAEGVKFGEVEELIVDPDAMKVRYLDIEVDEGIEGVTEEHHLLVPIGVASLDEKDDKVFIRTIQTVSLLKTPPYKGGLITREYEDELRQLYFAEKYKPTAERDYYSSEYYNEDYFYGPRRKKRIFLEKNKRDSLLILSASTLIGDKVSNSAGEDLGKIEEIMIDVNRGRIAYAVLSFGGFLGIGDKYFAIPWEMLSLNSEKKKFYLDIPKEKLKNAPGFDKDNWPRTPDKNYLSDVYNYYGIKSYW